jgi:hypothetical protein
MNPQRCWFHDPFWEGLIWALILSLSIFILAFCLTAKAGAGWGPNGCGPVGPTLAGKQVLPFTGWRWHNGRAYYFHEGVQIAGWDPAAQIYRTYDATHDHWSEPERAPWLPQGCGCCAGCACGDCQCVHNGPCTPDCSCVPAAGMPKWMTHGVKMDKLNGHERYTLNGKEVGGHELPNDAKRLRLTVIGSDEERQRVTEDLNKHAALLPLTLNLVVRDYRPDHWHVARAGFVTTGHPSIYLQAPDGKVLHRTASYEGPEKLAEAIRKADPRYVLYLLRKHA